jgi:hypothetical protein
VSIDTSGKSIEECVNELLGVAPEGLRNNMSDVLKA